MELDLLRANLGGTGDTFPPLSGSDKPKALERSTMTAQTCGCYGAEIYVHNIAIACNLGFQIDESERQEFVGIG